MSNFYLIRRKEPNSNYQLGEGYTETVCILSLGLKIIVTIPERMVIEGPNGSKIFYSETEEEKALHKLMDFYLLEGFHVVEYQESEKDSLIENIKGTSKMEHYISEEYTLAVVYAMRDKI